MNIIVDLSSSIWSYYEKLYESGKYADISIYVGKEPNNKIFLAHTQVLCTRNPFFENSLTGNIETAKELQKAAITLEDVSPDVFEILLRFIYTGQIFYDSCKRAGWINLLDGASKFELLDLLIAVEAYLLENQKEWIQQNIIAIHKYALSMAPLNGLLRYCNRIMVSHPDIVFKSNDLSKETLINLLKSDDLSMEEDDIWMSVVQWATKQVPELELGNDLDYWSSHDINTVKDIISDCIPHIRFFNMSLKKILLFDDLLPRKLQRDLLNYHVKEDYIPNTTILLPRTGQRYNIDPVIINNKKGQLNLGLCYENGIVVEKDVKRAVKLYKQAVEQGNTNAAVQYKLGYCYQCGIGVEKDAGKAVELYQQAVEQGNTNAQNKLGYCYQCGIGVEKDAGKAVELYQQAVEQGNTNAQNKLGYCYRHGIGVEKDAKKAFELYQKAAEQGDSGAQNNLGNCYRHGIGIEKDARKAVELYQKAAEQGDAGAQNSLGECYYYGTEVEKNAKKAFESYLKAVEQGCDYAQYNLAHCYQYGHGTEKGVKKAVELYQKAAEQGDDDAQYCLGNCYQNGIGVEKDIEKAVELYQKAAKQENVDAQKKLDYLHKNEIGRKKM